MEYQGVRLQNDVARPPPARRWTPKDRLIGGLETGRDCGYAAASSAAAASIAAIAFSAASFPASAPWRRASQRGSL